MGKLFIKKEIELEGYLEEGTKEWRHKKPAGKCLEKALQSIFAAEIISSYLVLNSNAFGLCLAE